MNKIILLSIGAIASVFGASLSPGVVNKQMSAGHEVNLGTLVYERFIHKHAIKNLRPAGLSMGDVTEKATVIAYGSCLSAQISEEIVKTYSGKSLSEEQLLRIVDNKIPGERVYRLVSKKKLMNDEEKMQELGMALTINAKRNQVISGLRIGEAQVKQARAQIESNKRQKFLDNPPTTLGEAIRMKDEMLDETSNQRFVLNVGNLREPNVPRVDSTGFLQGTYKSRFEATYFDVGEWDGTRNTPQGVITAWQISGGFYIPSQIDPNLHLYKKGTHRVTLNGDLVVMGQNCVLNAQGDQVRLVCPNSTGEIYTGGGETGIYCGTKSTVSRNSSGQFQFQDPVLGGEK